MTGDGENANKNASVGSDSATVTEPPVNPGVPTESDATTNEESVVESLGNDTRALRGKSEEPATLELSSDVESKSTQDEDESKKVSSDDHEPTESEKVEQSAPTESHETESLLPSDNAQPPMEVPESKHETETSEDENDKPQVVGYTPLLDDDDDEEEDGDYKDYDLEITEAPKQLASLIFGENVRSVAEPELMLSINPEALNPNTKRPLITGIDIVDSNDITGSYYRVHLPYGDNPSYRGSFLIEKDCGDVMMGNSDVPCTPIAHSNFGDDANVPEDEQPESEQVEYDSTATGNNGIVTEIIQAMADLQTGFVTNPEAVHITHPFQDPSIYLIRGEVECDCAANQLDQV